MPERVPSARSSIRPRSRASCVYPGLSTMQHFGNHAPFLGPIEVRTTRRHFKVKQGEAEDSKNIDAALLLSKFSITQVFLRLTQSVHPRLLRAYFPLPPSSSQPLRCIPRKARGVDLFLMPSLSKKTDPLPLSRSMFSLPPHLTHSCFPRPILLARSLVRRDINHVEHILELPLIPPLLRTPLLLPD